MRKYSYMPMLRRVNELWNVETNHRQLYRVPLKRCASFGHPTSNLCRNVLILLATRNKTRKMECVLEERKRCHSQQFHKSSSSKTNCKGLKTTRRNVGCGPHLLANAQFERGRSIPLGNTERGAGAVPRRLVSALWPSLLSRGFAGSTWAGLALGAVLSEASTAAGADARATVGVPAP